MLLIESRNNEKRAKISCLWFEEIKIASVGAASASDANSCKGLDSLGEETLTK